MRNTITFVCLLGLGWLSGCADSGFTKSDAGAEPPQTCSVEGQSRCFGSSFRKCQGGLFVPVSECAGPQICVEQLGCVDCDPSLSKTCVGNDVYTCTSTGAKGKFVEKCGDLPCNLGVCGSNCSQGTGLIYVVDESNKFLSFNPENNANLLKEIGTVSCKAAPSWPDWEFSEATPFSMSIDRGGKAWVLYTSGEIFWVDIKTAACQPSPFPKGQNGYQLFGMGFVTDAAASQKEKLFIHGGEVNKLEAGKLAYIEPATQAISTIGPLTLTSGEHSPELTGTGAGVLYGFFPNGASSFVRRLDKTTGATKQSWKLQVPPGTVRAWAFAHWGGKFYIFVTVKGLVDENSMILLLEPDTGKTVTLKERLPYIIVGAGVSTCAPVIE